MGDKLPKDQNENEQIFFLTVKIYAVGFGNEVDCTYITLDPTKDTKIEGKTDSMDYEIILQPIDNKGVKIKWVCYECGPNPCIQLEEEKPKKCFLSFDEKKFNWKRED